MCPHPPHGFPPLLQIWSHSGDSILLFLSFIHLCQQLIHYSFIDWLDLNWIVALAHMFSLGVSNKDIENESFHWIMITCPFLELEIVLYLLFVMDLLCCVSLFLLIFHFTNNRYFSVVSLFESGVGVSTSWFFFLSFFILFLNMEQLERGLHRQKPVGVANFPTKKYKDEFFKHVNDPRLVFFFFSFRFYPMALICVSVLISFEKVFEL